MSTPPPYNPSGGGTTYTGSSGVSIAGSVVSLDRSQTKTYYQVGSLPSPLALLYDFNTSGGPITATVPDGTYDGQPLILTSTTGGQSVTLTFTNGGGLLLSPFVIGQNDALMVRWLSTGLWEIASYSPTLSALLGSIGAGLIGGLSLDGNGNVYFAPIEVAGGYGNGADGVLSVAGPDYPATLPAASDATITGNTQVNGYPIVLTGTLTVKAGIRLHADGHAAVGATHGSEAMGAIWGGGSPGGGGTATNGADGGSQVSPNDSAGGGGGAGGSGSGHTGGAGGVASTIVAGRWLNAADTPYDSAAVYVGSLGSFVFAVGGTGAGAGAGDGVNSGGGGGGGAGILSIFARDVVIEAGAVLSASGGAGAAGVAGDASGGGGGGAGAIVIVAQSITAGGVKYTSTAAAIAALNGTSLKVTGGTAGAASGTGAAGTAGAAGQLFITLALP